MKLLITLLLTTTIYACSVSTPTNTDASLTFTELSHDFGTLTYKKEAECVFEFSNPGKTPLVVFEVKTSCGCTVPKWTTKPIKPNGKGEIKIKYDADFPGAFHKTITVFYNGKNSPITLIINGQVDYPKEMEAMVHE